MKRRRAWRATANCHGRDKRGAACPAVEGQLGARARRCRSLARWVRGVGRRGDA
jgi:hypothetical protein